MFNAAIQFFVFIHGSPMLLLLVVLLIDQSIAASNPGKLLWLNPVMILEMAEQVLRVLWHLALWAY